MEGSFILDFFRQAPEVSLVGHILYPTSVQNVEGGQ